MLVNLAAIDVHIPIHALDNAFGLKRVHALVHGFEFVDGGFDRFGETIDRGLGHAVDALVCMHANEEPVFPGIAGDKGLDVGNAHG